MDSTEVQCPYCGEHVEILLEEDLEGTMIWDCEVCCRPWILTVRRTTDGPLVEVATDDD